MAGVSGGADSVCLLLVLHKLQQEIPFTLLAVHVNHKIRKEAGADAEFAGDLCRKLGVPFFLVEKEVEALAEAQSISTEEAGRMVRYAAFEDTLRNEAKEAVLSRKARIAVAHNLEDRAETMLFHLFRGSGLKGLGSIRPVREQGDCEIIRPLLAISRQEIEAYLKAQGMSWCTDATNAGDAYTRNRIRHHILPYAEKEIVSGATAHICQAADVISETESFVEAETEKAYQDCMITAESVNPPFVCALDARKLKALHIVLKKRVILQCLSEAAGMKKDITATHVEQILSLVEKEGNRQVDLPGEVHVRREYDRILFEKGSAEQKLLKEFEVELPSVDGESIVIPLGDGETMELQAFTCKKTINIPENRYTKWFDYDKIKNPLKIRTRQEGDFFMFNEAFSRKSVQDYMVNEKIPAPLRERIWVLAEEHHVLWIVGGRISTFYKVRENTKCILQVQFRGGQ